jgi:hypothetical protein
MTICIPAPLASPDAEIVTTCALTPEHIQPASERGYLILTAARKADVHTNPKGHGARYHETARGQQRWGLRLMRDRKQE